MELSKECRVLLRYITGKAPGENIVELFQRSAANLPALPNKEQQIWDKCMRHPLLLLPLADAGMAWRKPSSLFRQRMIHYAAIAESIPEYSHLFLPRKRSALFPVLVFFRAGYAAFKTLIGSLLLPVL